MLQKTLQRLITSFVSLSVGALLGDVFLHIIPEIDEWNTAVSVCSIVGFLFGFVIEKYIHQRHTHHHDITPNGTYINYDCCEFDNNHRIKPVVAMNLIGDVLHNFVDGVIIAAAYLSSSKTGLATTIAIAFHEIPQEIGDFAILIDGGLTVKNALGMNLLVSSVSVLGTGLVILAGDQISESIELYVMAFGAGVYLYLVGSDLIPELHKKNGTQESIFQLICISIGISVMGLLLLLD